MLGRMSQIPLPDVLPTCELLDGFEERDREVLSRYGSFGAFRKGQTVIHEGKPQNALFLLVRGRLNAVHATERGDAPLGSIGAGEWFGEVNIFDPQDASAKVVAHVDSVTWQIGRDSLEQFLNEEPALGCLLLLGVGYVLARRTRALNAKLNATWEISW